MQKQNQTSVLHQHPVALQVLCGISQSLMETSGGAGALDSYTWRLCAAAACSTHGVTFPSGSTHPSQLAFKATLLGNLPCYFAEQELFIVNYVVLNSEKRAFDGLCYFLLYYSKIDILKLCYQLEWDAAPRCKVMSDSQRLILAGWLLCDCITTANFSKYKCSILSCFHYNYNKVSRRERERKKIW